MALQNDQAVCVRVWDWSETSQTVSLFARSLGLLRCLAKGSKRPQSAFSGGIELLTLGELGVIIKPTSELALLTQWDLLEIYPALRRDLAAHYAGLYMAELIQRFAADHDPHPGLFDALVAGLRRAVDGPSASEAVLRFQWAALSEAGYRPVLDRVMPSGDPLPDAQVYLFDPAMGALVGAHAAGEAAASRADLADWRLRRATVETLRRFAGADAGSSPPAEPESIQRAGRFLASYVRYVLGAEPSTHRLVFPDGPAGATFAGGRR